MVPHFTVNKSTYLVHLLFLFICNFLGKIGVAFSWRPQLQTETNQVFMYTTQHAFCYKVKPTLFSKSSFCKNKEKTKNPNSYFGSRRRIHVSFPRKYNEQTPNSHDQSTYRYTVVKVLKPIAEGIMGILQELATNTFTRLVHSLVSNA